MRVSLYIGVLFFILWGVFSGFFILKEKYINHKATEEIAFKELALDSFIFSGIISIGTFVLLRKRK